VSDNFDKLIDVIKKLRDPETGCPWDIKQDHKSIRKYFIEETYEAVEAIDRENDKELCAELGDVLLQVMLHSQIAIDRKAFSIDDVVQGITEKMIRRHPHVFGDTKVSDAEEVLKNWEEIKKQEKGEAELSGAAILKDVPSSLPALNRASRLGDKAGKLGFDWPDAKGVWKKVVEESKELEEVLDECNFQPSDRLKEELEHEIGDLLFSVAQLSRWLKVSPEDSLRQCCNRFLERFSEMEKSLGENTIADLPTEELEEAWQKAKTALKNK
jgi:tetrapyrrole methylase family protein/MazG family protein